MANQIENFWENILSEDPQKILSVYKDINAEEKKHLIIHLYKMVNEPGWQKSQRQTAQKAIDTIEKNK